jgi:hypothetical protein
MGVVVFLVGLIMWWHNTIDTDQQFVGIMFMLSGIGLFFLQEVINVLSPGQVSNKVADWSSIDEIAPALLSR